MIGAGPRWIIDFAGKADQRCAMTASDPIIISGGGIAGLATAISLAQQGRPSLVLEQARNFEEVGAGLQLGPNGMRAIEALGVREVLAPKLVAPRAVSIRDGVTGRVLTEVPLGQAIVERFGHPYHVVHRADLLGALLKVARGHELIRLETDRAVERFRHDGAGVTVTLRNGAEHSAPALIGADGVRSAVRQGIVGDSPPAFANCTLYRALIVRKKAPAAAQVNDVTLWLCPGGHVVHYPVSGGEKINVVAAFDNHWHEPGWGSHGSKRALLTALGKIVPELREVLDASDRWLKWAAADREPVTRWGEGCVTLIGDAAHPVLPYLAQGAAMALEDAVVLGRQLAARDDLAESFRRYEAERQPRTAMMRQKCRRVVGAYHARGVVRAARNVVLGFMSPERSYGQMAWIYGWH